MVFLFAVSWLGDVVVPLDSCLTEPEFQYSLRRSSVACAITAKTFRSVDYLQPTETSAGLAENSCFRMGHLRVVDEEGNIHLVRRGKWVIIQRGSNVYPRET